QRADADEREDPGDDEEQHRDDEVARPDRQPHRDDWRESVEEEDQPQQGDEAGPGQEAGSLATDRDALGDLGLGHLDLAAHDGGDVVAGVGDELAHAALGLTGGGMSDTTTGSPLGGGAGGRAGAVVANGAPARL